MYVNKYDKNNIQTRWNDDKILVSQIRSRLWHLLLVIVWVCVLSCLMTLGLRQNIPVMCDHTLCFEITKSDIRPLVNQCQSSHCRWTLKSSLEACMGIYYTSYNILTLWSKQPDHKCPSSVWWARIPTIIPQTSTTAIQRYVVREKTHELTGTIKCNVLYVSECGCSGR